MRQLTSLDAQFLAVESARTYGHVGGLAIYDPSTAPGGDLGVKDVCRLVADRLHLLPPFRWKLVNVPLGLAHPYWIEDPDFDLDFHIRESAVPPPGADRQLAETVARIFARPLDRNRPLWELYLIQGLPEGRAAMLTKIHHSVVDGVSGNEILTVLLDPSPEGRELPPPAGDRRPERAPGELGMLGRGLLSLPLQPLKALRSAPTALPHLPLLPGATAFPGGPTLARGLTRVRRRLGVEPSDPQILESTGARPPKTSFNGRISGHRRFAFGQLSLDRVKAIKNETGSTVNDVVVCMCAGALRDWLKERGELPAKPLVALVPVSVRTEDEQGTYGNKVAGMIVPIPTNEADPRRRLKRTHEYLLGAKERHRATPASLLTDATSFIPPAVASLAARTTVELLGRAGRPPVNVVISNVPGPRNPLFCAGAKLEANYPVSVVIDGVGLNITVMSYLDHLDFGLVSDRDQVDDLWPLLDRLRHSLDELESAAGTATNRSRGSKPKAKGRAGSR